MMGAHKFAYEQANGAVPAGLEVCHTCHGWVDPERPTAPPGPRLGERNHKARLIAEAVREIRRIYGSGQATQLQLAERFGVTRGAIGCIVRRDVWTHIA